MIRVGFQPMIPLFEKVKTYEFISLYYLIRLFEVHDSKKLGTDEVSGNSRFLLQENNS
jgi:hypothetical protein